MSTLLTQPLVVALAITLLHSVWIFTVLIGLGWWASGILAEARQRYVAYMASLVSLPLAFGLILFVEWRAQVEAWSSAALMRDSLGAEAALNLTDNLSKLGVSGEPRWMNYLAAMYLLGLLVSVCLSSYRYGVSVRMRRGGWPVSPELRTLFDRLRQEILPGRRVDWRITTQVAGALTVGVLRPLILFPVGLVNALSPDEVESILRHELTHLLRHDPIWNAVQEIVVCLFFYHPLVYFLAQQLNREREFACDDAVSQASDRSVYARALVRAAKFSLHPSTSFTMAATNNRHFSARIQRLFAPAAEANGSARQSRSFLLAPLAILPLLCLFAFLPDSAEQRGWSDTDLTAPVAQEVTIQGTITDCDTGNPLIGTSVMVEGTDRGTITDLDGNYVLSVLPGQQTISYAYVGYRTMRLKANVTNNENADVAMCKDKEGKLTLKTANGEFSFETGETLPAKKVSFAGTASDKILYIVDGKRYIADGLDDISPDDIEKIDVIKGEDKIKALGYGVDFEGAIIITMKKKE